MASLFTLQQDKVALTQWAQSGSRQPFREENSYLLSWGIHQRQAAYDHSFRLLFNSQISLLCVTWKEIRRGDAEVFGWSLGKDSLPWRKRWLRKHCSILKHEHQQSNRSSFCREHINNPHGNTAASNGFMVVPEREIKLRSVEHVLLELFLWNFATEVISRTNVTLLLGFHNLLPAICADKMSKSFGQININFQWVKLKTQMQQDTGRHNNEDLNEEPEIFIKTRRHMETRMTHINNEQKRAQN